MNFTSGIWPVNNRVYIIKNIYIIAELLCRAM